ncbi:MAG: ATP-binding protein [Lachnospiraceae bacterium]|nr:ATP-binding protein [Lachnospiraceae bacterium]
MTEKLPVGIDNFKKLRTAGFYYVDKTGFIKELLENWGDVNLFTRPRRFGKTLNMSMLKCFFEAGCDSTIFDGLDISKEKELCAEYMGKFPVIFLTLKSVSGRTFEAAKGMLRNIIGTEAMRFQFLMHSENLTEPERQQYKALINIDPSGAFTMSDEILQHSLLMLSRFLQKHFNQNTILLIDEYDVPLDKAYQSGYYNDMVELIRNLFGNAFKTNDSLYFAVLTGCLRVSKESIFTGLNNMNVYTVKDVQYNEFFGFTDMEVRNILKFYDKMDRYDTIKEWYDGYQFGNLEIYCPWDVISYCHALKMNPSANPQNYWVNTSSNDIIQKFVGKANTATRHEIELLIDGSSIKKVIHQELTYRDLDTRIDNLWSLLFTTGYLTQCGESGETTELVIPNREIRWIFVQQIREWFDTETAKDSQKLENFCRAFEENNITAIETGFTEYLGKTISIRDTYVKKVMKENFYHGILLGLFAHMDHWVVKSNAETGEGYSDITVKIEPKEIGIIIELKYAENAAFDEACHEAMRQIKAKNYEEVFVKDGLKTIYRYGIACYQKRCKVISM